MKHASGWSGTIVVITLMAAFSIATAAEKMYRWVDAEGNVTYSDQPPPADARETKSLNEPMPAADPDADPEGASEAASYAEQEAEFQKRQKERDAAAAEANEKAAQAAMQKQNCEQARNDLEIVTNPPRGRLRERNSEGELVYMSEEQLELRKAQAQEEVLKWCQS
jgi:hypothetical protein